MRRVFDTCCGCMKCMEICPVNEIKEVTDDEGFSVPMIDDELCVKCGQCEKRCQFNNITPVEPELTSKFAAQYDDNQVRKNSTSGGVFSALSDYFFSLNGAIFGVRLNTDFTASYFKATDRQSWRAMRGSKYIQADSSELFRAIKEEFVNRPVLVVATPCVIAAIREYFQNKISTNILLVDIVCHGVTSPKVFRDTIRFIENKSHENVVSYQFRSKEKGWHTYIESASTSSGRVLMNERYMRVFRGLYGSQCISRKCCSVCPYANMKRQGDITIGDCWGIDRVSPDFDDDRGTSLVLINTNKGKEIFEKIKFRLNIIPLNKDDCIQPQLIAPSRVSRNRSKFWAEYSSKGFEFVAKKYSRYGVINDLKHIIYPLYRKMLKK